MESVSRDGRDDAVRVTVGVDTHADQHVGVALDQFGRRLGTRSVPTTPAGFAALLAWAGGPGAIERIGIEGTGSYRAGLSRWRRARGVAVIEVERPHRHDRQARRRRGQSDPHHPLPQALSGPRALPPPRQATGFALVPSRWRRPPALRHGLLTTHRSISLGRSANRRWGGISA